MARAMNVSPASRGWGCRTTDQKNAFLPWGVMGVLGVMNRFFTFGPPLPLPGTVSLVNTTLWSRRPAIASTPSLGLSQWTPSAEVR